MRGENELLIILWEWLIRIDGLGNQAPSLIFGVSLVRSAQIVQINLFESFQHTRMFLASVSPPLEPFPFCTIFWNVESSILIQDVKPQ